MLTRPYKLLSFAVPLVFVLAGATAIPLTSCSYVRVQDQAKFITEDGTVGRVTLVRSFSNHSLSGCGSWDLESGGSCVEFGDSTKNMAESFVESEYGPLKSIEHDLEASRSSTGKLSYGTIKVKGKKTIKRKFRGDGRDFAERQSSRRDRSRSKPERNSKRQQKRDLDSQEEDQQYQEQQDQYDNPQFRPKKNYVFLEGVFWTAGGGYGRRFNTTFGLEVTLRRNITGAFESEQDYQLTQLEFEARAQWGVLYVSGGIGYRQISMEEWTRYSGTSFNVNVDVASLGTVHGVGIQFDGITNFFAIELAYRFIPRLTVSEKFVYGSQDTASDADRKEFEGKMKSLSTDCVLMLKIGANI